MSHPKQPNLYAIIYFIAIALLLFTTSCASSSAPTSENTPTAAIPTNPTALQFPTPQVSPTLPPTPTPHPLVPLQLGSDPYSGTGQYQTTVEPGAYSYGSTIVTAFQVGRFSDIGSANIAWATSTDGGNTWSKGFLPDTTIVSSPSGPYVRITDPTVTYDVKHATWMIGTVAFLGTSNGLAAAAVQISTSTNGGTSWNSPHIIMNTGTNGGLDKDGIACDNTSTSPYYGHCYAQWDDYNRNDLIQMSTSTDGGIHWSSPQVTADGANGLGAAMFVQPNGKVVVTMINGNQTQVRVFTSTNGGASWNSSIAVASVTSYPPNVAYHDNILLSSAMDGSGKIYLVWVDCRYEPNCYGNDLVMTSSTDGSNWQSLRRISIASIASGTYYYVSGLGADSTTSGNTAHLGLTYYYYAAHCASDCPLYVGFVSSNNGGNTWSTKTQLAGPSYHSWLPSGNNKVGDYISTTFCGGLAFPLFAIASAPTNGHLNESMYTMTGGLTL